MHESIQRVHRGSGHSVLELYNTWKRSGCKKVALSCPDKDTFLSIADEAEKAGLTYYAVVIVCLMASQVV